MQSIPLLANRMWGIVALSFFLCCANVVNAQSTAQTEKEQAEKKRRLFTSMSFGLGNAAATHYRGDAIMEEGFSYLVPSRDIIFELGYAITDKFHVISGWTPQILQLQFDYEGENYRFAGHRSIIPLTFQYFMGETKTNLKLNFQGGGYYALNGTGVSQAENNLIDPFNTVGIQAGFGASYKAGDNSEIVASYMAFRDLTGDVVRVNSARFAFGFRSYLF